MSSMDFENRRHKTVTRLDEIVQLLQLPASTNIPSKYVQTIDEGGLIHIEPCPLTTTPHDFSSAEEMFNLSIHVWLTKIDKNRHRVYKRRRLGSRHGEIEINLHLEPLGGLVFIKDTDAYFRGYFNCINQKHGCQYTFRCKEDMEHHCAKCKTLEEVRITYNIY